ncbi:unnamed protein product, partial [Mesorhabditis spiculigera]
MEYIIAETLFWASTAWTVVTLPYYCVVLYLLIVYRNQSDFHSTFFRMCTLNGLIDVLSIVNSYLGAVFPANNIWLEFYLGTGPISGRIYLMIAWGTRFWQGFTVMLLALNRATATVSPGSYTKAWSMRHRYEIYFVQFMPGCLIAAALCFGDFEWDLRAGGYYIEFLDPVFRINFFTMAFIGDFIVVIIILISYVIMIVAFRRKYNLNTEVPTGRRANPFLAGFSKRKARHERGLVFLALSVCSLEYMYFGFIVYAFGINTNMETSLFFLFYTSVQNIYSCAPPYLLLLFSHSFKRVAKQALCSENKQQITRTTSPGPQRNGKPTSPTVRIFVSQFSQR